MIYFAIGKCVILLLEIENNRSKPCLMITRINNDSIDINLTYTIMLKNYNSYCGTVVEIFPSYVVIKSNSVT